jgi:pilus assembly protein CpaE
MQPLIQIIDHDQNSRLFLKSLFSDLHVSIVGEHSDFAPAQDQLKTTFVDIVILSLAHSTEAAFAFTEKVSHMYPSTAVFVISEQTTPDLILRSMRAGAREFFTQPVQKTELTQAIQSIVNLKKQQAMDDGGLGKVIALLGTKGGVGSTTIATNLAAVMAKQKNKDVILLDLNLQFGNAALFINAKPQYSLVDVAKNLDSIDINMFKNSIPKSSDNIHILAGPQKLEDAEYFEAKHLSRILEILRSTFEMVIIDTRSSFDELNLKAFDEADTLFVVSNLEFPTIFNTKRLLELLSRMEYSDKKVQIVINRYSTENSDIVTDLEKVYPYPISWRIPNHDYASMLNLINYGNPVTVKLPKAKISLQLKEMAESLCCERAKKGALIDTVMNKFLKLKAH